MPASHTTTAVTERGAPRFRQFADRLTAEIQSGKLAVGAKLPGERELALAHGLSHLTVNKAVGGLVASGLLRRVPGRGTYVTGPVIPRQRQVAVLQDLDPGLHSPFLAALPRALQQQEYLAVMLDAGQPADTAQRLRKLWDEEVAACVYYRWPGVSWDLVAAAPAHVRQVFLSEYVWTQPLRGSYILTDFAAGGRLAVEHLLRRGRRRFLLLGATTAPHLAPAAWEQGCQAALADAGLPPAPVVIAAQTTAAQYQALMTAPHAPDAVLAVNDFRLVYLLDALRGHGPAVGTDFEAVGCYDTPWAEAYRLTSLSLNPERFLAHLTVALQGPADVDVRVQPTHHCRASSPAVYDR